MPRGIAHQRLNDLLENESPSSAEDRQPSVTVAAVGASVALVILVLVLAL